LQTLRLTGAIVCAALAVASLAYAIIALTRDWAAGLGWYLVYAGLLGVSAVLLWRRPGWRHTGVAIGLWVVGSVALYVVIVELYGHGYLHGGP
jgi:hypothetical protein